MPDYTQTPASVRASVAAVRIRPYPEYELNGEPSVLRAGETILAGQPVVRGLDQLVYLSKAVPMAAQTSGTLTVGKRYVITTFVAGDNLTNVGAAANVSGTVFEATGTTPTTWSNSSTLNEADPLTEVEGLAETSATEGQPILVVKEDPEFEPGLTSMLAGDTGIVSSTAGKIATEVSKASGWHVSNLFTAASTTKVNLKIVRSDAPKV